MVQQSHRSRNPQFPYRIDHLISKGIVNLRYCNSTCQYNSAMTKNWDSVLWYCLHSSHTRYAHGITSGTSGNHNIVLQHWTRHRFMLRAVWLSAPELLRCVLRSMDLKFPSHVCIWNYCGVIIGIKMLLVWPVIVHKSNSVASNRYQLLAVMLIL